MNIGNTNSSRLGLVMRGFAHRAMESNTLALFRWNDFGEILPDYSLQLFGFSQPFPVGQYFVAHHLLSPEIILVTEETETPSASVPDGGDPSHGHGTHVHTPHTHEILRQTIFRKLAPGDRVIVAWANPSDPVVIDRYGLYDPTLP